LPTYTALVSKGCSDALFGFGDFGDRYSFGNGTGSGHNPDYPVCLQVYGIAGNYIACGYTSLEQSAQSASGRAAQCIINPYFTSGHVPAGPHYRRHRRIYY
jgi:Protein of unknown function (DUF3551)